MATFLEAIVTMLPAEAGGRPGTFTPRDGSYRPFVRVDDVMLRVRFIEGPPAVAPGDTARVVAELEDDLTADLTAPCELDILEHGQRSVGFLTIARLW